jgi:Ca2+-binding RTX toxin-like protein
MAATNKLLTPLDLNMKMFAGGAGLINQGMIDALNRNPVLVARLNSYNNDIIAGYRIDPATGGKWINPESGLKYEIAPFEFKEMPSGSSPAWLTVRPGVGAIVFGNKSNYLNASTPEAIARFLGYMSHEIDHYFRGIEHFLQERTLIRKLDADKGLTSEQKVAALSGLIASREGQGIVANYEASKFYANLGGGKNIDIPVLVSSKHDLKAILDKVASGDISDLVSQAARFNSDFNEAGVPGVSQPYSRSQIKEAARLLGISLTPSQINEIPNTVTYLRPDGSYVIESGKIGGTQLPESITTYTPVPNTGTTALNIKKYQLDSKGVAALTSETWKSTVPDSDQTDKFYDFDENTIKSIEIDGARNDADYTRRVTVYDAQGRLDSSDVTRDDGTRDVVDLDQGNSQSWSHIDTHFDAQGREDWRNVLNDDGSRSWSDYDQNMAQILGAPGDSTDFLLTRIDTVPVGASGSISTTSSYLPGALQLDQVSVQQFDANGVVLPIPQINGTEINIVDLSTVTTARAVSETTAPDSTSRGPSATNNNLVSTVGYTVGIAKNFWNVNTATGNQAVFGYAITDGLRPGNSNFGLNINASSGLGLPISSSGAIGNTDPVAGPVSYSLFGSSLNNASSFNFNLAPVDPLVLDLNGDGVKLTDYGTSPVLFDADNDGGSLEQIGWVSAQDGIVVHDLNGDGKINNIGETLSEYYNGVAGSNGVGGTKPYANGFAALKSLDSNADNQFSETDTAWGSLRVWVDANHDGKTDAGELKTFAGLGITAINLAAVTQSGEVRDGNEVLARGTFTQNGISREAVAANFIANPTGSITTQTDAGISVVTEGIAGGAGATTAYVSTNTRASVDEVLDAAALKARNLTGGAGNDTLKGDAANNWLAGGTGADTLLGGAGDDVLLIDAADKRIDGGDGFDIAQVVGAQGVSLNLSPSNLEMAIGGVGNDVFVGGGRSTVVVRGGAGDDVIIGGTANDVLSGEDGDDTLDGGAGNDLIRGHRGRDRLLGGAGDDVLDGGLEDDSLSGGAGNDVLIGGRGDDNLNGGDGIDVAQYAGSYADYRITRLDGASGANGANGGARYRVVDTRTGQDGADTLAGVEKLSFADVSRVDLSIGSPLPVKDVLTVNSAGQALSRTAAHLLSKNQLLLNDRDWDSHIEQLKISEVLDAKGGTVALTASGDVLFTPDASYTGIMGFKYKVKDAEDHFTEVSNSATGQTEPMKAAVYLQTGDLPSDPLAIEQWYLSDINVMPVWQDYTGKGIKIGQFEPGAAFSTGPEVFDYRHPDLQPNADRAWLNTLDANGISGTPQTFSSHATMVAGVMVAARNGEGGVGVAYNATLAGHYIQGEGLEVSQLTQEITGALAKFKNFDVVNNSWGPTTSFGLEVVPTGSLEKGVRAAVANGRNGLGTAIVMAGGNDRATGANTNYNALTANRAVIVAGSINAPSDLGTLQLGTKPFSNPGASILVSAPGSNIDSTSRELIADNGSTFGGDYDTSQGTSFAAPIVSGVIALMLEANPALGYRDIQAILAMTATKVSDPNGTDWVTNGAKTWNGGGMHVSHDYGFGKVDARAAVRLAETWTEQSTFANEFVTTASSGILNAAISDGTGMVTRTLAMGAGVKVESAQVTLDLDHQRWGDLIIKLISPGGTESVLVNRPDKAPGSAATDLGSASSGPLSFSFNTTHVQGEQSAGTWTLQVIDAATGNVGTLRNWTLDLYGKKADANDVYVYTDEFGGNAGVARGMLMDSNGGRDTLNASAVTGNSTINLINGSTSTIAGKSLSISGDIEIAFGGDGNDVLTGNALSNVLLGGRGADVLSGSDGNDTLDGGKGSDVLTGGTGSDLFVIGKDAGAQDVIVDFATGESATLPETIALVGFGGLNFAALARTQVGADVRLDLGDGQSVLVRNRQVDQLDTSRFQFFVSQAALQAWQQAGQGLAGGAESDAVLQGTAGDDLLIGKSGNDTLSGNEGNDKLVGGAGQDTLDGGPGNDVLVLDGDRGLISYSTGLAGAGVRIGGAGADRFFVAPDGGGVQSVGLFGNNLGASNLIFDFDLSADKIDLSQFSWIKDFSQLKINKALNINSKFVTRVLAQAEGQSPVSVGLSAIDPVAITAAHFIFAGSPDATPLPGASANVNTVAGAAPLAIASAAVVVSAQPLPLVGTGGNDVLTGDAGANTINGLEGADSMTGRTGDDIYVVDNVGDKINELPGGGYDTVQSGVSYQLAENVEVLALTGTANLAASGNGQRNRLVGNVGDNRLNGGAEADDMVGGAGNDTYVVDNQLDTVSEEINAGVDTVESSVSWTLGNHLENLSLTGTQNINATGNELANALTGNGGDNILDGAQGADRMAGGAGSDTYYVDSVGDTVIEEANAGNDTVHASVNTTLTANVEGGALLGAASVLTGNALSNRLIGNRHASTLDGGAGNDFLQGQAGDDTLNGGDGNDSLNGGAGSDLLIGGIGNDTYAMGRGWGVDRVSESDEMAGNMDVVFFDASVDVDQLWFRQSGNDLEVSLIGTSDKLVVNNWYLGNQYHVEQFKSSNGKVLQDSKVQNLVQAMAGFSPPAAGQTTLPASYQSTLTPALAANWH